MHPIRCALIALLPLAAHAAAPAPRTSAEILAASTPADWRPVDPDHTLYLDLAAGRAIIELAPAFAPRHVANIKALVREKYFDGLPVIRVQDNYVTQWGDPDGQRDTGLGLRTLPAEFARAADKLPFAPLADGDPYAPEAGHSNGLPVARDRKKNLAWLAHCYAMVGAGRDNAADSGSGTELYVVIGHAPRHLDRNVTLVGRVVKGMEFLSALPRGTGALGFYETPGQHVPITRVRLAGDLPPGERVPLEVLRTEGPTWSAYVESRRTRREEWFLEPTGRIELCNVPIPVRTPAERK